MSFEGKVIAITGAASGIGLATAQILSKKGAIICLCDVDPEAMSKAKEHFSQLQAQFSMTTVDVSDKQQVESWIHGIVERYGRLDGAVNNAGIIGKHHGLRAVADLEDEEWHKIIAVNLTGTMYCMRAQLRAIVDGGSIVNLSSIHGLQGLSFHLTTCYESSLYGRPVLIKFLQDSLSTEHTMLANMVFSVSLGQQRRRTVLGRSG